LLRIVHARAAANHDGEQPIPYWCDRCADRRKDKRCFSLQDCSRNKRRKFTLRVRQALEKTLIFLRFSLQPTMYAYLANGNVSRIRDLNRVQLQSLIDQTKALIFSKPCQIGKVLAARDDLL